MSQILAGELGQRNSFHAFHLPQLILETPDRVANRIVREFIHNGGVRDRGRFVPGFVDFRLCYQTNPPIQNLDNA
jgi:hypothetical protein